MRKIIIHAIFASVLTIIFSSCEKEATVKPPKVDPKLVVYCFISPSDSLISVTVKQSQPIFSSTSINPKDPVSNASVIFSDGTNSCILTYNTLTKKYTAPAIMVPITAGKKYYLTVNSADGKSVSAETTIPGSLPADFDMDIVPADSSISFHWTDIAGEPNYYCLAIDQLTYYAGASDTIAQQMLLSEPGTDNNRDGKYFKEDYFFLPDSISSMDYRAIRTTFIYSNYDYYMYHSSLNNANTGGNPFAEPVLVYTNIKGGLGVFAAFLSTLKEKSY